MTPSPALDPDHEHLYRLLGMLPDADREHFWSTLATSNGTSTGYISEKMGHAKRFMPGVDLDAGEFRISYLCQYLIMFFGGNKPTLWRAIGGAVFASGAPEWEGLGQCFADDLTKTAWRLLVRYRRYTLDNIKTWDRH